MLESVERERGSEPVASRSGWVCFPLCIEPLLPLLLPHVPPAPAASAPTVPADTQRSAEGAWGCSEMWLGFLWKNVELSG